MMKLRSKKFYKNGLLIRFGNIANSVRAEKNCRTNNNNNNNNISVNREIKWELRPGGMLVQKRELSVASETITLKVSTVSKSHYISIDPTSTFGELKMVVSLVTGLEPREQRLLFKGKEKEDDEYLHMVGVKDKDKVLLLQDPAIKETKKKLHHALLAAGCQPINHTISV
ncbi:BAG family molecular chaperone regulator 2-like [Carica papaya]|uniref:BAG family molecular chaperone regulator 2-like n=1 Tax=Carica papaya TaxID=3649 RepID=UPI000B8CC3F1|nr:BAG family molecular chaperone regulator 2-like [Carica papaya]